MRTMISRTTMPRAAALTAVLLGVVGLAMLRPAEARSPWGANYFPNTTLITQDGKQVKFYDDLIKGKIVAIDLIYTECKDQCPLETARLRQVQKLLGDRVGKDIFFYSISIDPKHDTPQILHDYAEMYNAGPGWYFLTGNEDDIIALTKKLGLYSPDWGRDGHTADLLIGNEPAGQWMRNAATDNPHFLATQIGDFIDNFSHHTPVQQTDQPKTAQAIKLDAGQYVFATHCAACHTIGRGEKIGPDLAGVTKTRDHAWLMRFIAQPDKLLDEKDPLATSLFLRYKRVRMPNLQLADADVEAVIGYMQKQENAATAKPGNTNPASSTQAKK